MVERRSIQLSCQVCGEFFTAKRDDARFCTDRCRKRAQRTPQAVAANRAVLARGGELPERPPPPAPDPPRPGTLVLGVDDLERVTAQILRDGDSLDEDPAEERPPAPALPEVHRATLAQLQAVGRVDTPLAQAALALATRIDHSGGETGSGLASLTREWRAVLAMATSGAERETTPVERARDELAQRRARRG